MSINSQSPVRCIIFVGRHLRGENLLSARAIANLSNVALFGISEELNGQSTSGVFLDTIRVESVRDYDQVLRASRMLSKQHGNPDLILTNTETLLEPVAQVNETLALDAMSSATVRRTLDKAQFKNTLENAGIGVPRSWCFFGDGNEPDLNQEVLFPIVLKPLHGSGGLMTWRINSRNELELALELLSPSLSRPLVVEEFIQGSEFCIDTVTINNEPVFYSICRYSPSILEAVEDDSLQWKCVMPRDITGDEYSEPIQQGLAAIRALRVGNAVTHMEGFVLPTGEVKFVDATLRPAGARIAPMLAYSYDADPYRAWARAVIDGKFDAPWIRCNSAGTIFLRGPGSGAISGVDGLDTVFLELGALIVDSCLPIVGAKKSQTYTGDGYITIKHPDTSVVEKALNLVSRTVKVKYSGPPDRSANETNTGSLADRLRCFNEQSNVPVWEQPGTRAVNNCPTVETQPR